MNIYPSALPYALPGEPTPAALHREEFAGKKSSVKTAKTLDHRARQRVRLLQAGVTTRVGSYFA